MRSLSLKKIVAFISLQQYLHKNQPKFGLKVCIFPIWAKECVGTTTTEERQVLWKKGSPLLWGKNDGIEHVYFVGDQNGGCYNEFSQVL